MSFQGELKGPQCCAGRDGGRPGQGLEEPEGLQRDEFKGATTSRVAQSPGRGTKATERKRNGKQDKPLRGCLTTARQQVLADGAPAALLRAEPSLKHLQHGRPPPSPRPGTGGAASCAPRGGHPAGDRRLRGAVPGGGCCGEPSNAGRAEPLHPSNIPPVHRYHRH